MSKLKKGDKVKVLLGKDVGKIGTIEKLDTKKDQVFIAGVNLFKRHVKKQGQVEGGIIDIIKSINISNVALVCPNCQKPTRVGLRVEKGQKVRFCKKCQKNI
ncbi:50S ribosomal protein L24 [Candidatus Daviesbacteria bacterium]|nr:50S ribosomal protein L24 [Candidatus Daviesbacteria bacterium]